MEKDGGGGAVPTGCFKCGRPGHWSRDCPSSGPANPNSTSNPASTPVASKVRNAVAKPSEKGKSADGTTAGRKPPRTRPKLTPELLLSDDGLGCVLRHFPRSFKYHGRGHEVSDLGNLIALYAEWHSRLLPYYSFDQFIIKVEKVGATRRVRMCLRELKERVGRGGDPTKLHEPPTEQLYPDLATEGTMDADVSVPEMEDPPMQKNEDDEIQEEMFDEIYKEATDPPSLQKELHATSQSATIQKVGSEQNSSLEPLNPGEGPNANLNRGEIQITDEQRARMEANRLKALERATARSRAVLLS